MPSHQKKWASVFILGASSDIGQELCYRFALEAEHLYLSARNITDLNPIQKKIRSFSSCTLDLLSINFTSRGDKKNLQTVQKILKKPSQKKNSVSPVRPPLEIFVCAVGYLGNQEKAKSDSLEVLRIMEANYIGPVLILNEIAKAFQKNKKGSIVVLSSVAALRGRKKNYFYGSTKAGLSSYLSGLRASLFPFGVHVMTVLPGLVQTKMLKYRKLPPILGLTSKQAAQKIYKGVVKKKDIVYVGEIWRWVMFPIRFLPEVFFKRWGL